MATALMIYIFGSSRRNRVFDDTFTQVGRYIIHLHLGVVLLPSFSAYTLLAHVVIISINISTYITVYLHTNGLQRTLSHPITLQ
jgi:hypothetical protein